MLNGKLIVLAAITTVLVGCTQPPAPAPASAPVDTRMPTSTLSKSLAPGMTEAQVNAMREPDTITLQTCGSSTPKPWQCKVYKYGLNLWVRFQETSPGDWRVNSWS